MAYSYSKLYNIKTTGLRFFTVYGPMGRPDMAYYSFTEKLVKGESIQLYNYGKNKRDFTYIDDIVKAVSILIEYMPREDYNGARYKVYNIGNHFPIETNELARLLFDNLKKEKMIGDSIVLEDYLELIPGQPGDVEITYADVSELVEDTGFHPYTDINVGLENFVK